MRSSFSRRKTARTRGGVKDREVDRRERNASAAGSRSQAVLIEEEEEEGFVLMDSEDVFVDFLDVDDDMWEEGMGDVSMFKLELSKDSVFE